MATASKLQIQARVFLSPDEATRTEDWPCPAGVTVQFKKEGTRALKHDAGADGVAGPVPLEEESVYEVTIISDGFGSWSPGRLETEKSDGELNVWLSPKPGYCFAVLRHITSTGEPVVNAAVQVIEVGAARNSSQGETFTSGADGYTYILAPPGQVTLGFRSEEINGQQFCPQVFIVPYTAATVAEVRPLEFIYWPQITITAFPTVMMNGAKSTLFGTSVTVEYQAPGQSIGSSVTKTLAKGVGTGGISFIYPFPGQYTAIVTPPLTYQDLPIQPGPPPAQKELLSGGELWEVPASFDVVPAQEITLQLQLPKNQSLTQDANFEVSYGTGCVPVVVNRVTNQGAAMVPKDGILTIGLAGLPPETSNGPLKMSTPGQSVQPGTNTVILEYEYSLTINVIDQHDDPVAGAVIDVFDEYLKPVGSGVFITDKNGSSLIGLQEGGTYYFAQHSEDGQATIRERVDVRSPGHGVLRIRRGPAGGSPADPGNGISGRPHGGGDGEAVTDLSAYPVLTEEVSTLGPPASAGGSPSGGGSGAGYGQTVDQVMRDVLGWRPSADVAGFQAALTGAFQLRQVEGHTEWSWQQRGYAVQADMGALTGAQASIYARAKNTLDQIQPLLAGLTALNPSLYEPQDLETIRTVVSTELQELVNELALPGGPRIQRVNELFRLLVGENRKSFNINPDLVQGQLAILRQRFGLTQDEVQTVDEERILTNFRIIVEQVLALQASWYTDRKLLSGMTSKTSLGTLLIQISRSLEAVCESVNDLTFSLDSVYVDAAQRQVVELRFADLQVNGVPTVPLRGNPPQTAPVQFGPHEAPIFLADLLDWVVRACRDEGPKMIQDAGKQGIFAFQPVLNTLRTLIRATGQIARERNDLPAGMQTPRVGRAIKVLAAQLDEAANLTTLVRTDLAPQIAYASVQDSRGQLVSEPTLPTLPTIEIVLTGSNFRKHAKAILIAENGEDLPDVLATKTTFSTPSSVSATFVNPAYNPGYPIQLPKNAGTTWQVSLINDDETQSVPIEVLRVPRTPRAES